MKPLAAASLAVLLLAACADRGGSSLDTGLNIGASLLKNAVDLQCRDELNKRQEWRMMALVMTAEQKTAVEDKICGCVSEEAPNYLGANELLQLADASSRGQVLASVTAKTLSACVQRAYKK